MDRRQNFQGVVMLVPLLFQQETEDRRHILFSLEPPCEQYYLTTAVLWPAGSWAGGLFKRLIGWKAFVTWNLSLLLDFQIDKVSAALHLKCLFSLETLHFPKCIENALVYNQTCYYKGWCGIMRYQLLCFMLSSSHLLHCLQQMY